jgi:hypothetical protein
MRICNLRKLPSIRRHLIGGRNATSFLTKSTTATNIGSLSSFVPFSTVRGFSQISNIRSFPTLFDDDRKADDSDVNKDLRSDVKAMGSMLGELLTFTPLVEAVLVFEKSNQLSSIFL